ncbi:MAG TPA: autotransporter-associated beta strand repeat-containing protein, partial [Chthoniobacterales bacterium]|nr:autotransporter-associated beta strand repeat-containing protein [Chthoniobacterales bacterium]
MKAKADAFSGEATIFKRGFAVGWTSISSTFPSIYRRLAFVAVLSLSVFFSVCPPVKAATRTWDGGGADALWDTILNWDNDALPANGDIIVFGSAFSSGSTISLNGNRTVGSLQINTITGFSLTNSTLTLGSGDITRVDAVGTEADQTISSNIALGADGNWNIAGSGNFTVSGIVSGARKLTKLGAGTLILSGANTFTGEFSASAGTVGLGNDSATGTGNFKIGAITVYSVGNARTISNSLTLDQNFTIGGSLDLTFTGAATLARDITITTTNTGLSTFSGVISGGHHVTSAGAGTLVFSGANTYSGETRINAGVLNVRNGSALGDNTKTKVASGAALEVQGGINIASEPLELSGTGISSRGALRNISGNNTWGGTVTLTAAASIASDSGLLTIGGNIVNGGFGLTVSGAGNVTASGVVSGTGTLTKSDSGVLTLSGTNTYSGATTINGGTINVNSSASLGNISAGLTINAGTLQVSTGFTTTRTITLGDATSTFQIDPSQTYTVTTAIGGSGSLNKT